MDKKHKSAIASGPALYKLRVTLVHGPLTQDFLNRNPEVSRTIAIRGDQTLEDLHWAIYDAFDREEAHMYEFQFGKKPDDRKAKRYVMPECMAEVEATNSFLAYLREQGLLTQDEEEEEGPEDASKTTIGSLPLKTRSSFWYWFDFGDNWWHKVKVVAIENECPKGKYPKVVERVGESPPQYPNWDDEDYDEEDDIDEEEQGT